MRNRGESRMVPKLLASATGYMALGLNEIENTGGRVCSRV